MLAGEYEGPCEAGRFEGFGTYISPQGRYIGNFSNGQFNGHGTMYVKGGKVEGIWENGKLVEGGFIFDGGLRYKSMSSNHWEYCSPEDPRFHSEIEEGLELGEPLRHTSSSIDAMAFGELPPNCYDTVDGMFNAKENSIYSYKDTTEVIRLPTQSEKDWILQHCRHGPKTS